MVRHVRASGEGLAGADSSAARNHPVTFAVFALARAHRAAASRLLADLGLAPGQELLLMHLADRDEQTQTELTRVQGLDHSTVARSVARLEDAGLVTRTRSSGDARATLVTLTAQGRQLLARVDATWSTMEQQALAGLGEEEAAELLRLLGRITENVDAEPGSSGSPAGRGSAT